MTPGQEIETLRRILYYCQDNQVTISAIDLNDMFNHWVKLKSPGETQLEKKAPPHFSSRPRLENPYIKPSTHLEVMITKTLQDFLGFEQVGIDDNFFELGATSLNLIQINQSLVEQLRQDVPVVLWFEYPTVRTLAAFLSLSKDQSRGSEGEKFDRSQILSKGKSKMKQMNVKSGRRSHETD